MREVVDSAAITGALPGGPVWRVPAIELEAAVARQRSRVGALVTRALDVVVAVTALVVLAPLLLVLALLIRCDSRGPSLFRQTRIGRGGEPFTIYKLRTMTVDNDDSEHARYVAALTRGEAACHDGLFKLTDDPRTTRLGRLLRVTSLDEVPQLVNVVRGEMSLVGPRPATPAEAALWDAPTWARVAVRPGMTGLWQVSGRSRLTFEEMVRLDLEYVARRSVWLDLGILVRTPIAVVRGATA